MCPPELITEGAESLTNGATIAQSLEAEGVAVVIKKKSTRKAKTTQIDPVEASAGAVEISQPPVAKKETKVSKVATVDPVQKSKSDTISQTKVKTDAVQAVTSETSVPSAAKVAPVQAAIIEEETPVTAAPFRALGLSDAVMRAVVEAGFETPTPIQEQSIPILLKRGDLIGQAQTGTGKTAAFALPMAELLDSSKQHTQAIILLPTRELCIQVAQEMHNLSKYSRLKIVPVYGGQPIDRQFRSLMHGPQIVVGTPGRVLDHLRRGTLNLSQISMVVLDEADEMLNMGFLEDVEEILKSAPADRQTALFSATMPPRIAALARTYLKNAQRVTIESKHRTVDQITQKYYEVIPSQKVEALARILDMESPGSAILFCRTRREVDDLGEALQSRGFEAETLHGEMNQASRDRVMNRFRTGQVDLLIATDVAARGLDIDQITHVINYDIPWDVESYIHRIGRTGRAGRAGDAITLVSPRERFQLKQIERFINTPILAARVPSSADIASRRKETFKSSLKKALEEGSYENHLSAVKEVMTEGKFDPTHIAAAAMHLLWLEQKGVSPYEAEEVDVFSDRVEQGMTRLFLQIGRQDGIRPTDIVGAIANEAGVAGNIIGAIDIMERSTFVDVPESVGKRVIEALSRTKIRGKSIHVDIARPRDEGAGGFSGPPSRFGGNRNGGGFPPRNNQFDRGNRHHSRPNAPHPPRSGRTYSGNKP